MDENQSSQPEANNSSSELIISEYGKIKPAEITQEMQKFYLDYAMSVIVSRALPDIRDGLKPVHRRILYAMKEMNLMHPAKYVKCAKVVGEVLGKFHPHGDSPVYESLVRLAQDFSLRYPLVDGQGNFGSVDGDRAAAMRYTECRLHKITTYLLTDIDKATVPMRDNFDATLKEPEVLPALMPNLLLMGADGIAVGMATKIPPHNLGEVVDALLAILKTGETIILRPPEEVLAPDHPDALDNVLAGAKPDVPWDRAIGNPKIEFQSDITIDKLLKYIPGPDFPTGGYIFDPEIIKEVYTTGRGSIPMRAKTEIEEVKNNRFQIVVTEIPYQVNKANLVSKIAQLVREKKIEGISDLRDESDRTGIRIVIELKRDAKPKSLLNQLYKHTQLQTSFPANIVALVNGTPQLLNLKSILLEYIKHRQQVIIRRTQFELRNQRYRAHILLGLKIALDHIEEIIATIRGSRDSDHAKEQLMGKFGLTEIQAVAILDMQLRKLSGLERQKIEDEYNQVMADIARLDEILDHPSTIASQIIPAELKQLKKEFADSRRTVIVPHALGDFNEEDLVPQEKTIIAITHSGYVKRLSPDTFRSQRRGGKGVSGMKTKEEDNLAHLTTAYTHDHILFFTDRGRVFKLKVWELPEGSRTSKGQAIVNLLNIEQGEQIQSILTLPDQDFKKANNYILLATRRGVVKKTSMDQFANIRTNGIIAIKLQSGDQLVWAAVTRGNDQILMVSHEGQSIRFSEKDIRPTARDTMGVRGMKLKSEQDYIVGLEVLPADLKPPADKRRKFFQNILVVMEHGLGKQTPVSEFPLQKRGGKGVKVANITAKTGKVVSARLVTQNTRQVILTTKSAQIIKLPLKNVPVLSRPTQGVIMMRPKKGDLITAMTVIGEDPEQAGNPTIAQ